ncbi:MAG: hypothetical protein RIS42_1418, partial [Bacteroidota bacterium]
HDKQVIPKFFGIILAVVLHVRMNLFHQIHHDEGIFGPLLAVGDGHDVIDQFLYT